MRNRFKGQLSDFSTSYPYSYSLNWYRTPSGKRKKDRGIIT